MVNEKLSTPHALRTRFSGILDGHRQRAVKLQQKVDERKRFRQMMENEFSMDIEQSQVEHLFLQIKNLHPTVSAVEGKSGDIEEKLKEEEFVTTLPVALNFRTSTRRYTADGLRSIRKFSISWMCCSSV